MFSPIRHRVLHKFLKVFRLTYADITTLPDLKKLNIVRTIEQEIKSNTSIFIESPIHVKVQPIDVLDPKAHNKLTMTLYSVGKDTSNFQLVTKSQRLELSSKTNVSNQNDLCIVQVPFQQSVNVSTTENASVHLSNLEGVDFTVKTKKGSVVIGDLKAQNIKVESLEGELKTFGKMRAANIDLKTGLTSSITCNNLMATDLHITTHAGPISVKSCYTVHGHLVTALGNIRLENAHNSIVIDVIQKGALDIVNFSGSLKASLKSGEVYMHVSKFEKKSSIFIHEKGKIDILVPKILTNLPATTLIAENIVVDKRILQMGRFMDDSHPMRFRFENERHRELHVVCKNGTITLQETPAELMF